MSDTNAPVSRRQFCAGACQVASGATLATMFAGCGGSSPTSPSGPATTLAVVSGQFINSRVQVTVAGSALNDVGNAVLVQSIAGVFLLTRSSTSAFTALDGVCTHQGCTITGADGATFVCPCHGSRYNRNGQVTGGPAPASLRQYPTTFADGIVTIAI